MKIKLNFCKLSRSPNKVKRFSFRKRELVIKASPVTYILFKIISAVQRKIAFLEIGQYVMLHCCTSGLGVSEIKVSLPLAQGLHKVKVILGAFCGDTGSTECTFHVENKNLILTTYKTQHTVRHKS